MISEHCSPLKEVKSYLKESLFPGLRQEKEKMLLEYCFVPETKCSKNDKDPSKEHRSQLEGAPTERQNK